MSEKTREMHDPKWEGGYNPDRPSRPSPKYQVGPAPTDDPRGKARKNLKEKIEEASDKFLPGKETSEE